MQHTKAHYLRELFTVFYLFLSSFPISHLRWPVIFLFCERLLMIAAGTEVRITYLYFTYQLKLTLIHFGRLVW